MSIATDMLAAYIKAETEVLANGRSWALDGRSVTRENLAEIRAGRIEWERRVAAERNASASIGGLPHSLANFSTR
ncbi:hypothetical protein [Thiorhodococcus fuscus]|uniref:Primosomal replication protein PriB/PriC domain protein n=1 Tax=Thiorhodococcus fuscus TaxID=527200 RepID=A0ABW4YBR7_9GAMM